MLKKKGNMKMTTQLTQGEKEQIIRYYTQCYRRSRQRRLLSSCSVQSEGCSQDGDLITVRLYEGALEALPSRYREIIVREFLDESADGWFYNYYPKSTFYRLRQRAISEFMDCLNV